MMSGATEKLFELLDKVGCESQYVTAESLREACMRVQEMSNVLSARRRYNLYCGLLLHKQRKYGTISFAKYASAADNIQHSTLVQLKETLGSKNKRWEDAELQGFMYHFTNETKCAFDQRIAPIATALASVVAAADLPSESETLSMFFFLLEAFCKEFVAPESSSLYGDALIALFRLLLQYHDPQLSLHLGQHLIDIGAYIFRWARRLFVMGGNSESAVQVWDWLLVTGDATYTVYFILAYLISCRKRFLNLNTKKELEMAMESIIFQLPVSGDDNVSFQPHGCVPAALVPLSSGGALVQNADVVRRNTPRVTRHVIRTLLYPGNFGRGQPSSIQKTPQALAEYYSSFAALPLERGDYLESFTTTTYEPSECPPINYTIVDCRARVSFDAARLPTAVHAGDDIGFDTEKINKLVLTLSTTRGGHLCVFGTGRQITEEINLLNVVTLRLVHGGFPYVSSGRFRTVIPLMKTNEITMVKSTANGETTVLLSGSGTFRNNVLAKLVPRVDFDGTEARRKAEEISNKAKEQVEAVKTWGMGLFKRVSERLKPRGGVETINTTATLGESGTAASLPAQLVKSCQSQPAYLTSAKAESVKEFKDSVPRQNAFSLGGDDTGSDDEFDFITSVAAYKGPSYKQELKVENLGETTNSSPLITGGGSETFLLTTTAVPTDTATVDLSATAAGDIRDVGMEIDREFEELFGGSS